MRSLEIVSVNSSHSEENGFWLDNIYDIYKRMKDKVSRPYLTNCHISLVVHPGVYSPDFFTDSFWFSNHLPNCINLDSNILEIGTGTGIISIILAKKGARKVVATDIVPSAVENAKVNINIHKLDNIIEVREGDVYCPIKNNEKFDYIFWAHPFNNSPYPISDTLLRTGFDYNYNSLRSYIENAKRHLNQNGKLLIGTGDSADLLTMREIANNSNYYMNLLVAESVPLEFGKPLPIEYRIYEFVDIIQ
jgi:release factor glutamine methyltransferase